MSNGVECRAPSPWTLWMEVTGSSILDALLTARHFNLRVDAAVWKIGGSRVLKAPAFWGGFRSCSWADRATNKRRRPHRLCPEIFFFLESAFIYHQSPSNSHD